MKCEHKREWYRPLWRSDLVGDGRHVFNLRHGWWCPGCGGEQVEVDDGVPKIGEAKEQAASWSVRLTIEYEVVVSAERTTTVEAAKLALALEAALRQGAEYKKAQAMRLANRVGWRVTGGEPLLVWYWFDVHDYARRGCALIGMQTKTTRPCRICSSDIEPGSRCWKGSRASATRGSPRGLHDIEGPSGLRFCVKCIAELPREEIGVPSKEAQPPRRGQPDLRLVPRPPPEPPKPRPPSPRRRRRRPRRIYTFTVARAA